MCGYIRKNIEGGMRMANIRFLDNSEIFEIHNPEEISCLYFPLASETGLKSSIAPDLGGDCKLDQEGFLL